MAVDYEAAFSGEAEYEAEYVAAVKPEVAGRATPSWEAQTLYPDPGCVFSRVEIDGMPEPTARMPITENGEHHVERVGVVDVSVPQGVFPAGTLQVTANGPYDVTGYAGIDVAVPIVFDLGLVVLELLTVTVAEDYTGALGGAMAALYASVASDIKTGGVNGHGIVYLSLVGAPGASDQLVSWGAHYNSGGVKTIGRRYDGAKIIVQNGPAVNSWTANLKAGTTYRMAWFTLA